LWINGTLNHFQGKDSSDDEDLLDVPDDDQYDTEDSFIDDAELVGIFGFFLVYLSLSWPFLFNGTFFIFLFYAPKLFIMQDEYFEVDNSAIKHDGFFVNRGKLERM